MADLTIGVIAAERLAAGLVDGCRLAGKIRVWPEADPEAEHAGGVLQSMPVDAIVDTIVRLVSEIAEAAPIDPVAVGIGMPGIVRAGVVEESPNLRQTKGAALASLVETALKSRGISMPVFLYNDADAAAAGIAATCGRLTVPPCIDERSGVIRTWTLGTGIGFGRYPAIDGIWEGGHTIVTLDPKETYCGCGGTGHLEGIMGERAMRLRFLDLEPHEVFAKAAEGDPRCSKFVEMWHRALAAATASSVHIEGPGRFYITGNNAKFINIAILHQFLHEMILMSPLQGSVFEVIKTDEEVAITGAGVNAISSAKGYRK
ncbi:MAG: N-acetyl-D-glucosamine kinase [Bryobacterales bacterium]|nr:N-acetyl-D-glucosamine kinase [Bryobacterales bacterium]